MIGLPCFYSLLPIIHSHRKLSRN